MNIFSTLTNYGQKWNQVSSRKFTQEEIDSVSSAYVVPSEYGCSVCFVMKTGGVTYIPLSQNSTKGSGEEIDLTQATLVTLERQGTEIQRVEA